MWELFVAFFIVSIIGFLLYRRLRRSPEKDKSKVAGKYAALIAGLTNGKPHYLKSVPRAVKFDVKKGRDNYVYVLTEADGKLIVVWTIESQLYGRRGKEWAFVSDTDQQEMLKMINSDLNVYLRN